MNRPIKPSQLAQLMAISVSLLLFPFSANADVGSNIDRPGGPTLCVNYDTSQVNGPVAFSNAFEGICQSMQSSVTGVIDKVDSDTLVPVATSVYFPMEVFLILNPQDVPKIVQGISLSYASPVKEINPMPVASPHNISPPKETVKRHEVPWRTQLVS